MLAVFLIGFAAIAVGFFYLEADSGKARQAQEDLQLQFQLLRTPEKTAGFEYSASHKMQHALVTEKFRSSLSYQELRDFYGKELRTRGWQFVKEEPLYDWSRDFGGKAAYYKKNDYTATLEYQGGRSDFGYTYALNFSWGLH